MSYSLLGAALGPIAALILFGVIALALKLCIARYMPDCWLKRQLLAERIKSAYSASNRRVLEQAAAYTRQKSERIIRQ